MNVSYKGNVVSQPLNSFLADQETVSARFLDAPALREAYRLPGQGGACLSEQPAYVGWAKRGIDIVGATMFFCVGAPVMAAIAIAIRMTSPGPVLFRQLRIGASPEWARGEPGLPRTFTIFKFRTMHVSCDHYAITPEDHSDIRITRVGRFLRRTSLDELPQLFSVLRGDMSLVGPRPEMPFVVKGYKREHRERLLVRPGITGLWQLYGSRSRPIHHGMHLDRFYLNCWSFGLDATIIWRTFRFVLRGGNI